MVDVVVEFENHPFAEGRFRSAYKGKWIKTSKAGQSCVVKHYKDSYSKVWEKTGWDTTLNIYSKAQEYASRFGNGLKFTECEVQKVVKVGDSTSMELNEYVTVEEYLEGKYVKWCNNYGSVSPQARGVDHNLPAFMHWTWYQSKGQEMVADIQGVKESGGGYKLTDPAMLSVSHKYGATDTGIEGMAMFFLVHGCSPACEGLRKPTIAQFAGKIPDSKLQQALAFQQLSRSGTTTYSHEMIFGEEIKKALIEAFIAIANGRA